MEFIRGTRCRRHRHRRHGSGALAGKCRSSGEDSICQPDRGRCRTQQKVTDDPPPAPPRLGAVLGVRASTPSRRGTGRRDPHTPLQTVSPIEGSAGPIPPARQGACFAPPPAPARPLELHDQRARRSPRARGQPLHQARRRGLSRTLSAGDERADWDTAPSRPAATACCRGALRGPKCRWQPRQPPSRRQRGKHSQGRARSTGSRRCCACPPLLRPWMCQPVDTPSARRLRTRRPRCGSGCSPRRLWLSVLGFLCDCLRWYQDAYGGAAGCPWSLSAGPGGAGGGPTWRRRPNRLLGGTFRVSTYGRSRCHGPSSRSRCSCDTPVSDSDKKRKWHESNWMDMAQPARDGSGFHHNGSVCGNRHLIGKL